MWAIAVSFCPGNNSKFMLCQYLAMERLDQCPCVLLQKQLWVIQSKVWAKSVTFLHLNRSTWNIGSWHVWMQSWKKAQVLLTPIGSSTVLTKGGLDKGLVLSTHCSWPSGCIPIIIAASHPTLTAAAALTSSIFEAQVREPPHVPESDCIRDARESKVKLASPSSSFVHLLLRCCLFLFPLRDLRLVTLLRLVDQDVERLGELLLLGDDHHVGGQRSGSLVGPNGLAIVGWMEGETDGCATQPPPPATFGLLESVEPLGKYHAVLLHRRPHCALYRTQRWQTETL